MTKPQKRASNQRRPPAQARAKETVETIFEAVARILERGGRTALTTNRIAEQAGISVGSIYAYFPNKEAILLAMARRELDAMRDRVVAALAKREPDIHPVRRAIRALIRGYGQRGKVRRVLMETLFAAGGSEEMARPVSEVAEIILAQAGDILPPQTRAPTPIELYVLTRAIDSVIRTATYEAVPFRDAPDFEDALVRLVAGYVGLPGGTV